VKPHQVASVTGASGGIGRAAAEGLADARRTALVGHLRGEAAAGDVVAAEAAGGRAFAPGQLDAVDLAGLVAYLASPAPGRVEGQVIRTTGGIA
jgi:NAD(P)-dependent dehydrogenase (short-subunit alcohol dehydrogenase family)